MINRFFVTTKSIVYKLKTHRNQIQHKYLLHSIKQKQK